MTVVSVCEMRSTGAGDEPDLAGFLRAFEQRVVNVLPVDHLSSCKAARKFIGGDLANLTSSSASCITM